jgi:hypothetical protein
MKTVVIRNNRGDTPLARGPRLDPCCRPKKKTLVQCDEDQMPEIADAFRRAAGIPKGPTKIFTIRLPGVHVTSTVGEFRTLSARYPQAEKAMAAANG